MSHTRRLPLGSIANIFSVAPINTTIERIFGLDPRQVPRSSILLGMPGYARGILKCIVRAFNIVVITLLAILVPSFDTIMGLLGSAMAFSICIILPLAFHLKLYSDSIGIKEKALNWFLIAISSIMAIIGTAWVFLPTHVRERLDGLA